MTVATERKLNKDTYPRLRSAAAVHDQSIGLVRTNFEGYSSGFGAFPGWQNLKQMRQMVSTTSLRVLGRKKRSGVEERNGRSRVVLKENGRASLVVPSIRNLYVQSYESAIHHKALERIRSLV